MGVRLSPFLSGLLTLALVCLGAGQETSSPVRPPTGLGQGGTSTPILGYGSVTLSVQVLKEDKSRLEVQALVRVRDTVGGTEKWDTTHQRGEASIPGLFQGKFDVEVSALGYQTSITHIELYGLPTEAVQVVLKKDPAADSFVPPMANISRKAREASERGLTAMLTGNLKDAEKNFRGAQVEAPQNAQIHYLLGVVLLQRKRGGEAERCFQQAITLDPTHRQALTALGTLRLEEKDYAGAAGFLGRAVAAGPREWRPHFLLADARLMQKQYEQALVEAQQAVDLSQNAAPLTTFVLGEVLGNLGRNAEAVAALRRFLEQAPGAPEEPSARQMIAALENADPTQVKNVVLDHRGGSGRAAAALVLASPAWMPPGVDDVLPPVVAGAQCELPRVLAGVGRSMQELGDDLQRYSATETLAHENIDLLGQAHGRETRQSQYLVEITQPQPGFLQINEERPGLAGVHGFSDGIRTQGLLGFALIFHPTMQENFEMACEGLGELNGEPAWLLHFRQRADRPQRVQAFRVGTSIFGVSLKGRAWIAAASFHLLRIETELTEPILEARLTQEHQIGEFGPVQFKSKKTQLWLPRDTQVYLEYRGRRLRVSEHFEDFVLFSVDSQQKDKPPVEKDPRE